MHSLDAYDCRGALRIYNRRMKAMGVLRFYHVGPHDGRLSFSNADIVFTLDWNRAVMQVRED